MIGTQEDRNRIKGLSNAAAALWLGFTGLDQWARELGGVWILPNIVGDAEFAHSILLAAPYLAVVFAAIALAAAAEAKGQSRWWGLLALSWFSIGWWSLGLMAVVLLLKNRWELFEEAPIPVGGNPFGYRTKFIAIAQDSDLDSLPQRRTVW